MISNNKKTKYIDERKKVYKNFMKNKKMEKNLQKKFSFLFHIDNLCFYYSLPNDAFIIDSVIPDYCFFMLSAC